MKLDYAAGEHAHLLRLPTEVWLNRVPIFFPRSFHEIRLSRNFALNSDSSLSNVDLNSDIFRTKCS